MTDINLTELTGGGEVRNLTGHEQGVSARRHYGLDLIDDQSGPTRVIVPQEVYTLTPSFFQGMFSESVRALGGREGFLRHYMFDASALIMRQIDRGISASTMRRDQSLVV